MDPRERLEEGRRRRWLLLILLLLFLGAIGAGVGGFVVELGTPDEGPALSIDVNPDLPPVDTSTTPGATSSPTDSDGGGTPGTPTGTTPVPTTTSPSSPPPPTPPQTTTPTTSPPTVTTSSVDTTPTTTTTTTPTTTPTPSTATTATTTPEPTTTLPGNDSLDLGFEGNALIFDYQNVKPGEGGTETIALSNTGTVPGNLSVENITAVDAENGIVGSEGDVDSTPTDGELSDHLRLSMSITYPDGTTLWLFGTDDGLRTVADLAAIQNRSASRALAPGEQATVTVEWLLPSSTGNVVQSDSVSVDVLFALRAEEG